MSLVPFGLLSLLIVTWAWMTQPLFSGVEGNRAVSVESGRLEAHVRKLSKTFFPRDAQHPENLDRLAAYIRQEFERADGKASEQPYEVESIQMWGLCCLGLSLFHGKVWIPTAEYGRQLVVQRLGPRLEQQVGPLL